MEPDLEEPWEGRMWGVFATEGDAGERPIAAFANEELANEWLKWMRDRDELCCDYIVARTDITEATFWNGVPNEDPKLPYYSHADRKGKNGN